MKYESITYDINQNIFFSQDIGSETLALISPISMIRTYLQRDDVESGFPSFDVSIVVKEDFSVNIGPIRAARAAVLGRDGRCGVLAAHVRVVFTTSSVCEGLYQTYPNIHTIYNITFNTHYMWNLCNVDTVGSRILGCSN